MGKVRIVTDSTARFEDQQVIEKYNIAVVPSTIHLDSSSYVENTGIRDQEVFERLKYTSEPPRFTPPTVEAFSEIYRELSTTTDQICVIVHSRQLSQAYENAQSARSGFLGRCEIAVIDSQTTCAGLGYLVETTAREAKTGVSIEGLVHFIRSVIPRIYIVLYVDSLEYIQKAGLLGQTQALLGSMLELKPLLTIEDGKLITMEKARTHAQAIDKMFEFVAEFTHIERLCILQNTLHPTQITHMIQERLTFEFSRSNTPIMLYEPLTLSFVGPDATGLVIMESDTFQDDVF